MLELAHNLERRFKNSYDALQLCSKLKREGYTVIICKDDETKYHGQDMFNIYVYKDKELMIKVTYIDRNDETEYKQYILYYSY